jgi:TfoX/Sxy family transcriptional regulator of competence genes
VTEFDDLSRTFLSRPGVETSRMFGSVGLKVAGKVFAMQVNGALVVKLSNSRAADLVASGQAQVFDPGHGRPMKQWIRVPPGPDWQPLAEEAFALVSDLQGRG